MIYTISHLHAPPYTFTLTWSVSPQSYTFPKLLGMFCDKPLVMNRFLPFNVSCLWVGVESINK